MNKEDAVAQYLYLSLVPEALIASMLAPGEFASYYAVGTRSKTQGQAVFVEIDPDFRHAEIPVEKGLARCLPHRNGEPKRSVYISVYRVLERLPLSTFGRLHLVTKDGRTLGLERNPYAGPDTGAGGLHFYHELAPTRPAVVSTLGPGGFYKLLMGAPDGFEGLPAVAFAELRLGNLESDPEHGDVKDLPYENIEHLRSCLSQLGTKTVASKIFDRANPGLFPYRTIKDGVYVGNAAEGLSIYRLPDAAALRDRHHEWWRSASM